MAEHRTFNTVQNSDLLDNSGVDAEAGNGCGVSEEDFPCIGKCYSINDSISGTVCRNICPYCSIWTSMPDISSLEVAYIFDCPVLGYGRRMKG